MRTYWMLLLGLCVSQFYLSGSLVAVNSSVRTTEDLVLPLGFVPLELRKPTANYSWNTRLTNYTFREITKLVLELEPLDLPGRLNNLEVVVIINGAQVSEVFEDGEHSFDAPSQLGMLVDTSVLRIDGSTDIQLNLKTQWGFSEAGVKISSAQFVSFNPQPSFGEGSKEVPLVVEWNTYQIGSVPPVSLYFTTVGFLGEASGSNRLQLNSFIEIIGVESPWVEFFLGNQRLYYGTEEEQWINTTLDVETDNCQQLSFTIEYHPHRSVDRNKQVMIRVKVFAEYDQYVDSRAIEREQILSEIPKISELTLNVLILNAIFLPLLYFRKRRLEERISKAPQLMLTDERD